jgi:tetratricopeptide (TPR) repeat protein
MAAHRPRSHPAWLLSTPLVLLVVLPVVAVAVAVTLTVAEAVEARSGARSAVVIDQGWLSQNRPNEGAAIPAEVQGKVQGDVQGWFHGAKAAASKGEAAEAPRLQKQVLAWLEANPGAQVVFRARALINLGTLLSDVGQRQEALAPTQEAVRLLGALEGNQGESRRFQAMALTNLRVSYTNLGRRLEALVPSKEAVKIYRELAKSNLAFLGDLATSLHNLGVFKQDLGEPEQARIAYYGMHSGTIRNRCIIY